MTAAATSPLINSSPANPCPICGRDDKSGKCRFSNDGPIWLCHHGSTFSPPQGLKEGETHLGKDFQLWAYTGETKDGRCSIYKLHEEKRPALRIVEAPSPAFFLARQSPEAKPEKGVQTIDGSTFYSYGPLHQVQRDANKQFFSHHRFNSNDQWIKKAGENNWPLYNEAAAIAADNWLLEVEGEKVCDIASSIGLVAISQPGNKKLLAPALIAKRYLKLLEANCKGIVYLADNDDAGKEKAIVLQAIAKTIELPFICLAAEDIWPNIPKGGSLDDLTEEELKEAINKLEKAVALNNAKPKALATAGKAAVTAISAIDEDGKTAKAIAALLEKLLAATLAEDQPLVDALKSRAWGYQLTREVLQERLLALWGQKKGLLSGSRAPARSRTIGKADPGPGLQQLQPGYMHKNDLHVLAADAGAGKTLTSLELAICLSICKGFMDQQEGRAGKEKGKVLFIASDGGASAWSILNDYCDQLQAVERGADIQVWAEDLEAGEAAWNVSLPNLERLAQRMAKGDLLAVIIDTANACFQTAGISPYTGPVDQYLRLLKAIVCPSASLWINCHTTRSGQGMKAVGGHPAWQEVPSAVHRIERKKEEGKADIYKWTVEKFRGESPRSFNYQRVDGEFVLVDGSHYQENIGDLLLLTIEERQKAGLPTKPSALAEALQKGSNSIWCALQRLRQQRLIRSKGTSNRITDKGLARLAEIKKQLPKEDLQEEEFF